MVVRALVIVRKHNVQHVLGDRVWRQARPYVAGRRSNGKTALLVQNYASAIRQQGKLADPEALGAAIVTDARCKTANCAQPHHGWRLRAQYSAIIADL